MAAVELKKRNWKFNKKFVTWFKKADGSPESSPLTGVGSVGRQNSQGNTAGSVDESTASQKVVGRYVFFDFEQGWQ